MTNFKTLALSALMIPALAACGTGYTNDGARGYGYDRDNVEGHNVYMENNDSYMNYQMRDTHCDSGENCKDGMRMTAPAHMNGMIMPDGGRLMTTKSSVSYADAVMMAQNNCRTATGINIWKKKMWDGHYVVRYTCFNR